MNQRNELMELEMVFATASGEDRQLDLTEFQTALEIKDPYFARRIFSLFDEDASGTISQQEFIDAVGNLIDGSDSDKVQFAFQIHDIDGSNSIDEEELARIIESSLIENKLAFSEDQVSDLVQSMFKSADADNSGAISFSEFEDVLCKYPDLQKSMAVSPAAWLTPKQHTKGEPTSSNDKAGLSRVSYWKNNWPQFVLLLLYAGVNLFLFFNAVQTYAANGANGFVQIARGCGAMLNFNGALILIPMMRHFITWIRKTPFNNILPTDESIAVHKLIGHVMFGAAIVHTVAHLSNYLSLDTSLGRNLFGTRAGVTGLLWLLTFAMMWVTALPRIRKGGNFRLFYLAHLGYGAWIIVGLLHGPVFWRWLLIPGTLFAIERTIRFMRVREPVHVVNAYLLPSKVLGLVMERSPNFSYQPGDYLFLKCPAVSDFEWHPFTISSAPETQDVLTVHIRAAGNWTDALYRYFEEQRDKLSQENGHAHQLRTPVFIDGPYGTPSSHIFQSKVAVLIGTGIGVTPFASILKSILLRKQQNDPSVQLEKVYFYWINRGQRSFEWFLDLLSKIEAEDKENLFDLNIHLTGTQTRSDMKSSTLFIAMDILQTETQVDLITGLKAPTQFGRPDWNKIFTRIEAEHGEASADVYFCGSPGLSRILDAEATRHGFGFHKENF